MKCSQNKRFGVGSKVRLFLQIGGKSKKGTEEGGEVRGDGSEGPGRMSSGEWTLMCAEAHVAVVFESLVFAFV